MKEYLFMALVYGVFIAFGVHLWTAEPPKPNEPTPYLLQPEAAELLEERITLGDSIFEELYGDGK